ncbi:hypothetical protein BHM03_00027684 [Ensete ventricosum]|nr:hypothetical protein BHM03_00027684 [Ensete ventricosum]
MGFSCTILEFQILAIPNVLAHGKSYEYSFREKNTIVINFVQITRKVSFRSVFRAPSRNLKKLVIPNVLAHEKSYEILQDS